MYLIGGKCTVYRLQKPPALLAFCLNPIRIRVPKKPHLGRRAALGCGFFFSMDSGLEPIAVQTLVTTLIFAIGENANRVLYRPGPWAILVLTFRTLRYVVGGQTTHHIITFVTTTFYIRIAPIARAVFAKIPGNQYSSRYIPYHKTPPLYRLIHYIMY